MDAAAGVPTAADAHIATCVRCRADLAAITGTREVLAQVRPVEAPALDLRIHQAPAWGWLRMAAVAAGFLLLVVALAGVEVSTTPEGTTVRIGLIKPPISNVPSAALPETRVDTVYVTQPDMVPMDEVKRMQDQQLRAFAGIVNDYAATVEGRRAVDYELIQYEIEQLRLRTDDRLYQTNLVMYQLLNNLTYVPQTSDKP